ncbi:3-(3-hydroxy-phenyl)propionate/3-hydroxycinnamic acid hydroxylase [Aspergillus udagawae]|nr:3-(3-hydroxy-phenyl)propionate/3-hydroxycinnamic acid hydroxylase [Aspergillus udagawae]
MNPQTALRASCEPCRKAKVRCKREGESCSRCKQREQKCEFSPSSRKRIVKGQPKPHRDTIDEMKNRLERMESLLLARRRSSRDDNRASSSLVEGKEDDASYYLMDRIGFSSFIGSASGLALLSPRGLRGVSSITHSTELLDFVSTRARTHMLGWSEEMMSTWQHLKPDDQTPLPPKGSSILAVNYFFAYVNSTLPLFDQRRFMERFNSQYSEEPPTSVAWYASLNAVLGIGALVLEDEIGVPSTVLHPRQTKEGGGHVLSCLRNCYSVFTQLSYSCREVMGVQALIGMAMILETLLDVEAGYMAIGSAARLALGLGLNRDCNAECSTGEVDERRNVFWVLYVLDRGLSFRLGRPPTIPEEDIQISEPASGKFAHLVRLIRIESEIYTRLYSVRARDPDRRSERLAAEDELYQKLLAWQYSLPYGELRPGQVLHCPNPEQLPSTFTLHAEFYNCQLMLWHWEIGAERSSSPEDPRWSSKCRACLAAARDTVKLLDSLREGGELFRNNLARRLSYYPLCAFLRLFINILLNPHDPSAFADLDWLRVVLNTMSGPLLTSSSPLALLLFEIIQKLTKTADDFIVRTLSGEANETGPPRDFASPDVTGHEVSSTIGSAFGIPRDDHTLGSWCPHLPPPFSEYAVLSYGDHAPTQEQRPLEKMSQFLSHSDIGASDTLFPGYESISSEVQGVDSGLSSPSLHRGWQNPPTRPDGFSSLSPPS